MRDVDPKEQAVASLIDAMTGIDRLRNDRGDLAADAIVSDSGIGQCLRELNACVSDLRKSARSAREFLDANRTPERVVHVDSVQDTETGSKWNQQTSLLGGET